MLAQVDALVPLAKTVASATDEQTRSTALASYSSALTNLGQTWDGRALVIETGRPASVNAPTSPLTVLEGDSTKPLLPPALSIARGDAISVAGADFIVDATIELFGDQPTKLMRIDSAAERWLIANVRFAADATKAPVTIGSGTATVNGQTLAAHGTGTSEAEVIGVSGSSGRQRASYQVYGGETANGPIAFVLSWPGTDLSLAGHGIQLDEFGFTANPAISRRSTQMGIMDRISRLLRANVNDMLDRAEDPESTLDQILRDMETNIGQARTQVASMIAQQKELQADLNEVQGLSTEWQTKAQRAVEAGKDDLAREALRRKKDNDESAALYQQQLDAQTQTLDRMKSQLTQLESKYQTAMSQRDTLIARQRRAKSQQTVADAVSRFSPSDPSADLERIERKIRGNEARAEATIEMHDDSLDSQFAELDYDTDVEDELTKLKASMGKSPEAIPPASTGTSASPS